MTTQEREALRERVAEMVRWAATTHTEHRVTVVDAATDRILALLAQPEGEREPYRCARHQQTVGACAGCSPQARADQILHFALVTLNEASRSVAARITEARAVATCEAAFGAAPAVQPTQDAEPDDAVRRLRAVIERDRSQVARCIAGLDRVVRGYSWLAEGRGPYEWDDDKYQEEFGRALDALRQEIEPLRAIARDWSDCPTTRAEVEAARAVAPRPEGEAREALIGRVEHAIYGAYRSGTIGITAPADAPRLDCIDADSRRWLRQHAEQLVDVIAAALQPEANDGE